MFCLPLCAFIWNPTTRCEAKAVGKSACPGMWPSLDHPLLLGLARMNETELAWEEWVRNSLHWQTNVTGGKQWVGQWSRWTVLTVLVHCTHVLTVLTVLTLHIVLVHCSHVLTTLYPLLYTHYTLYSVRMRLTMMDRRVSGLTTSQLSACTDTLGP